MFLPKYLKTEISHTTGLRFACILLALSFVSMALPVSAGSMPRHQRQLLEARVEDLLARLYSFWDLHSLPHKKIHVDAMDGVKVRTLAGVDFARLEVRLRGQADLVLAWLSEASRAHVMFKPPFEIQARDSMGRPVVVDVVLWRVASRTMASGIADEELLKLKDDLLWHESGLRDDRSLLSLMEGLMDFEQVHLQQAKLKKGLLSVRAYAVDGPAKKAFQALVQSDAKALAHGPRLDLDIRSPSVPMLAESGPPGLTLRDCPVHQAVATAGMFSKTRFFFVSDEDRNMSGEINALEPNGLLRAVLSRTGLPSEMMQDLLVVSNSLSGKPVDLEYKALLSLSVSGMNAAELLRRAGRIAKVQVLVSDGIKGLVTANAHGIRGGRLLGVLAWALGLKADKAGDLIALYSKKKTKHGHESEPVDSRGLGSDWRQISVNAFHAPLVRLVALLTGKDDLRDCGEGRGVTLDLKIGHVDSKFLLDALLRAYGKEITKDDGAWKLVSTEDIGSKAFSPCSAGSGQSSQKLRLFAVVRSGRKKFALMAYHGLKWLKRGDRVGEGLALARIHDRRVVLTDPHGQVIQVFLGPEASEHLPLVMPGPTKQGLGDLRLVGTMILPNSFSVALVQNRTGDVFRLVKGQAIGRRCGKVTFIGTDRIGVHLGCAVGKEPQHATLYLQEDGRLDE